MVELDRTGGPKIDNVAFGKDTPEHCSVIISGLDFTREEVIRNFEGNDKTVQLVRGGSKYRVFPELNDTPSLEFVDKRIDAFELMEWFDDLIIRRSLEETVGEEEKKDIENPRGFIELTNPLLPHRIRNKIKINLVPEKNIGSIIKSSKKPKIAFKSRYNIISGTIDDIIDDYIIYSRRNGGLAIDDISVIGENELIFTASETIIPISKIRRSNFDIFLESGQTYEDVGGKMQGNIPYMLSELEITCTTV